MSDMGPVVWAALIQGSMTLCAAGLAVWGVSRQIGNWRHEAPGRRKIQVSEDCMMAALTQRRLIGEYATATIGAMEIFLNPTVLRERIPDFVVEGDYWDQTLESLDSCAKAVRDGMAKLESATDTAEIYFGRSIRLALAQMRSAARLVSDLRTDFFDPTPPAERSQIMGLLVDQYDMSVNTAREHDRAVSMYRVILLAASDEGNSGFWAELAARISSRAGPVAWWQLNYWLPKKD